MRITKLTVAKRLYFFDRIRGFATLIFESVELHFCFFDRLLQFVKEKSPSYRKPYTGEELNAILEAAHTDPLMYSLFVTATCTAMRRKDSCFLRWDSVGLEKGFITVKTSKTGEVVDIPMANMLQAEIENQRSNRSEGFS